VNTEGAVRVVLVRLRCFDDARELRVFRDRYVDAGLVPDIEIDMGDVPSDGTWWELSLPPCPDCGMPVIWFNAGSIPGVPRCVRCGSLFAVETRYRDTQPQICRILLGSGQHCIYEVPAGRWPEYSMDPQQVVLHASLLATREEAGQWRDPAGRPVTDEESEQFEALPLIGSMRGGGLIVY